MHALVPDTPPSQTVKLAELDEPAPGPDELVLAVAAFSINRGETFLLEAPPPGWRPGKDIAGVVVQAAATGRGPRRGDRVVAHPDSAGWAELVAVPVDRVAVLPPSVSFQMAAALPLAGLTALRLVRAAGSLASRRLLLTGASGGVGHFFTELAAAQGGYVTAVTASAERGVRLQALGASAVVRQVGDAAGRFHVGLDSVGGDSTAAVLRKLHDDGLLIWFGQASRIAPTLDFFDWSGGSSGTIRKFDYTQSDVSVGQDLATLVDLVATGRLHPEIGLTADWEHTSEVIRALVGRAIRGNAVLSLPAAAVGRRARPTEERAA